LTRRERIFAEHQDTADRVACQTFQRVGALNGLHVDDYRQIALAELWKIAARRIPKNVPAGAYFYNKLKGAVIQGIRDADEVGRSQRSRGKVGPTLSLDDSCGASRGGRLLLVRETLAAKHSGDAAYDELGRLLTGLGASARAAVYLTEVQELTCTQAAAVLGMGPKELSELVRDSLAFLRAAPTRPTREAMLFE